MFLKRLAVATTLLPIGLALIYWGGWIYTAFIALVLGLASWEYVHLFQISGYRPANLLVIIGSLILVINRSLGGFENSGWLLSLAIFASMTYHLLEYERGRDQAGADFGITLGGILYFGWLGSYLISLRNLPDGLYWLLLSLPTVWLADSGAYIVGKRLGRRMLSPRLSPHKTWEGYLGGVATGILGAILLSFALQQLAGTGATITPLRGMALGAVLGIFTPLGDLGESMFTGQAGVKDSSNLVPGHGGIFDRIDSWIWAGAISYYLIVWLFT